MNITQTNADTSIELEDLQISILHEGIIHADGGVVFGNVAQSTWRKMLPTDEENRVPLGVNQLLVRGNDFVLLIDCGMGMKLPHYLMKAYNIKKLATWSERLQPHGVSCEEVTHVILTHLHYDHCGGATYEDEQKKEVLPQFPYARYFVQRGEWEQACQPDERTRNQYRFHNFLPLREAGKLELMGGNTDILDRIRVSITGGHTKFHSMVVIERNDRKIFFPSDICPTPYHVNYTWHSAYDLYPLETMSARKWFLQQTIGKNHLSVFTHDPDPGFKKIVGTFESPKAEPYHASK